MRIKFESTNGDSIKVDVDFISTDYTATVPAMLQRVAALASQVHATIPLESINVAVDDPMLPSYVYTVKAGDGRTWKQTIVFTSPQDSLHTFEVSPGWRKSEFVPMRPMRDEIERLITAVGCQKLVISWPS